MAQPVALGLWVALSYAAVVAVVFAEIGEFQQAPNEHLPAVPLLAGSLGLFLQKGCRPLPMVQQVQQALVRQVVGFGQLLGQFQSPAHGRTPE